MILATAPADPVLVEARAALAQAGGPWINATALAPEVLARAAESDAGRPGRALIRRIAQDVATEALLIAARARPAARDADGPMDRLLDLWQAPVLRWCRLLCRPGVSPEDAAADALMALVTDAHRLEDPRRFRAWLWAITWRTVRGYHRRAFLRRWVPGLVPDRPDPRGDAGLHLELAERDAAVREVLGGLDAEHTELLWLAYAEGLSRAELAVHLGLAPGTLNRRLTHARAAFERPARARGLGPEAGGLVSIPVGGEP